MCVDNIHTDANSAFVRSMPVFPLRQAALFPSASRTLQLFHLSL